MTKTLPKLIAGLGVLAGLSVAALPLASYAAGESSASITITATVEGVCLDVTDTTGSDPQSGTIGFGSLSTGLNSSTGSTTVQVAGNASNCGGNTTYSSYIGVDNAAGTTANANMLNLTPGGGVLADFIATGTPASTGITAWGLKLVSSTAAGTTPDATFRAVPVLASGNATAVGAGLTSTGIIPAAGGSADTYVFDAQISVNDITALNSGTYKADLTFVAAPNP